MLKVFVIANSLPDIAISAYSDVNRQLHPEPKKDGKSGSHGVISGKIEIHEELAEKD